MAATVCNSRSVGSQAGPRSQNGNVFPWSWWLFKPVDDSLKTLDRVSSASSATSSNSAGRGSSSDSYFRSESAISTSSSSDESKSSLENYSRSSSACLTGFELGKDYVPDKSEMQKVFEKFDANRDGKICGRDLHRFMGMSLDEAKCMLKSVNLDSDGCVNFEEFYSLYSSLSGDVGETDEVEAAAAEEDEEEDDTLLQVFKVFDRNGDGVITPQELQEVLTQLGIPEGKDISNCKEMIKRVDSNGDELIDITEFKTMMRSRCFQD